MSVNHQPSDPCDPADVAMKNFFLGPQSENAPWMKLLLDELFDRWFHWRKNAYPDDGVAITTENIQSPEFQIRQRNLATQLGILTKVLEGEGARFSPRYIGHMFSEISLPALLGHLAALLHNPNNISKESSLVGISIENDAIDKLKEMVSYPKSAIGHFTSGGTVANIEAMIQARTRLASWLSLYSRNVKQNVVHDKSFFRAAHIGWQKADLLKERLSPSEQNHDKKCDKFGDADLPQFLENMREIYGKQFRIPVVLVPATAHYSWQKSVKILGLGSDNLWMIDVDTNGRLAMPSLKDLVCRAQAEDRPILMIVSIAGTTELGQFDPIDQVQDYLDELASKEGHYIWHHVDAAYGGFFCSLGANDSHAGTPMKHALGAIHRANSLTLDPHKLGYVPYASGVSIIKNPMEYCTLVEDVPYVRFDSMDPGPFTLEGSRPATGAAATWMIAKAVGLNPDGYGRILSRTIKIRKLFQTILESSKVPCRVAPGCDSNILCFNIAPRNEPLSQTNARTLKIARHLSPEKSGSFVVSKTTLSRHKVPNYFDTFTQTWEARIDTDQLHLIRLCLLNPFFDSKEMRFNWSEEFLKNLEAQYEI